MMAETKDDDNERSRLACNDLLDALCICQAGWSTDTESKQYAAAQQLIKRRARRLYLEAELEALKDESI